MRLSFIQHNNKKAGFTLVETLVAITILMVSIVGPLTIASKGLVAAVGSRDQVIASYLAQDALEYIKNMRDDALLVNSSTGWGTFLSNFSTANCTTSVCGIETSPTHVGGSYSQGSMFSCVGGNYSKCSLYIDSQYSYYTHNSKPTTTLFTRTFIVTQETVPGLPDAALVTVTVTWKEAGVVNNVVLNDMIFNTTR